MASIAEISYLLEMVGIDKVFPGTHALDHVNFDLKKGEIHALIGQNGSGKSTLMNILSGTLLMDEGKIFRNQKAIAIHSPVDALEHGIAMIHQEMRLFPELSVAENLYFGNYPYRHGRIDWKRMYTMADEAMSMLSGEIKGEQRVGELSIAQQQLVEIVRALVKNTEVVIMDEPTASLTNEEAQSLFQVVEQVKETGVSIIFISHRLDEIMQIADRITVLRDGVLIGTKDRNEIKSKDELVDMMIRIKPASAVQHQEKDCGPVILETKNITYGKKLQNVSIQLHAGEVLGIAGLVGAGRTELLKTIFGVYKPDAGEVIINGSSYKNLTPQKAVKLGIAYMSEDRKSEGLLLKMNIEDNIIYSCMDAYSCMGILKVKERRDTVDSLIAQLRLKTSSPKSLSGSLSGGNQQKVVVAKWLAANSSILLMDEPTRGIDVGAKSEIYALVRKLADAGKSIIFVSSELEEVQLVSDRILVMSQGMVKKELKMNASVEEMMSYAV